MVRACSRSSRFGTSVTCLPDDSTATTTNTCPTSPLSFCAMTICFTSFAAMSGGRRHGSGPLRTDSTPACTSITVLFTAMPSAK
jgi:hypothetical protein